MYCRFADAEMSGRGADSGSVLNDVHSQITGSSLDGIIHMVPSLLCATIKKLCGMLKKYDTLTGWGLQDKMIKMIVGGKL